MKTNPDTQTTLDLVNLIIGWGAGRITEVQSVKIEENPDGKATAEIVAFRGDERLTFKAGIDFEDLDSEWEIIEFTYA